MKICVGSAYPGGPDAEIIYPFEDSELFDYYVVGDDGDINHVAQTRRCLCSDLIEPVVRRAIDAVIVKDLSPASLMKFACGRVRVFVTPIRSIRASLEMFRNNELSELTMKDFARSAKKHIN